MIWNSYVTNLLQGNVLEHIAIIGNLGDVWASNFEKHEPNPFEHQTHHQIQFDEQNQLVHSLMERKEFFINNQEYFVINFQVKQDSWQLITKNGAQGAWIARFKNGVVFGSFNPNLLMDNDKPQNEKDSKIRILNTASYLLKNGI